MQVIIISLSSQETAVVAGEVLIDRKVLLQDGVVQAGQDPHLRDIEKFICRVFFTHERREFQMFSLRSLRFLFSVLWNRSFF